MKDLIAVDSNGTCDGCVLRESDGDCPPCTPENRTDGREVIFVQGYAVEAWLDPGEFAGYLKGRVFECLTQGDLRNARRHLTKLIEVAKK